MEKVSLVVPCYNEEGNIHLFYDSIKNVFKNLNYLVEVIFIDDGSKDDSLKKMKELNPVDNFNIKIISFSRNFGKEAGMYAGFKNATGDYVVVIDVDMQQNPALIKDMLNVIENNPDCDSVVLYQEKRNESPIVKFLKKRFYNLINKMSDVEFKQDASDFRLFKRTVVEAILQMGEANRFSKGIFSWVGFNKIYLPYTPEERATGTTKWKFRSLVKYAISGITSFSVAPLKLSIYLGMVISALAFLYMVFIISKSVIIGIDLPGFATTISIILLMGGIQLIILGIIGEYLSKTFMETKRRPAYIIRETLTKDNGNNEN